MQKEVEAKQSIPIAANVVLWLVALVVLVGGVLFATLSPAITGALRYPLMLAFLLASIGILWWSRERPTVINMIKGSYFELQKIVWASRAEVMQTTWIVLLFVVVVALVLWLMDWLLGKGVALILGF